MLELRPPVGAHKGTAVAHLLGERGLERALYAGDDTTDLDAFNALRGLELGVHVAVASPEGPAELRETADIVVDGPTAMLELLRSALSREQGLLGLRVEEVELVRRDPERRVLTRCDLLLDRRAWRGAACR